MAKPTDIRIVEAVSHREKFAYRTPMKFGGRTVSDATVQRVVVTVENREGKKPTVGIGEMTMGTAWAWPSKKLSPEQVSRIVLALVDRIVKKSTELDLIGHPIDLGLRIIEEAKILAQQLAEQMNLTEPIPELAILLACSPIDAAIHDAFGRQNNLSSFETLTSDFIDGDLSQWLGEEFAGVPLSAQVLSKPKTTLSLYHLVGALDPLSAGELSSKVGDGLPETLEDWIKSEGLTHLKVKLSGTDLDWDVGRMVEIDRIATATGLAREWHFSLDFNECCPDEDYVIDFLERVERLSKSILQRLQYIEQPTGRDLKARRDITMHRVGRLKPVVIDESLIDMDSLRTARQLGYSGIALKACKGQTESLLMAAAAKHYGMFIGVQDLTCVGASFLHSASLAAHLPTVTFVEGNGRQYCPAGNAAWEPIYRPMFRIRGGVVPTELLGGPGLGFRWPAEILPKELAKFAKSVGAS
ncbi:MAG: mandelate racemase/muconate lactonizing enzyme family protein [Pirellulales bacterium]